MKGLFKAKPRTPVDIVRQTRDLLVYCERNPDARESKREDKMADLFKNIREMKSILYGNSESEPVSESCAQLTQEFFRENTLRLLIRCLPKLNLEARKDATQVVANLQRQQVQSKLIASDYLEANIDLMDILIAGYENTDMALHYGAMLRECIRHQSVARYVLESAHMKKFFDYIQLPNFDIAADAAATFKELMTRHKSTVAEFLSKNYDWFFADYNSKLLESSNYITRRQAVKLLGDILLDRSNSAVMTRYVSSRDNLRILMNLLRWMAIILLAVGTTTSQVKGCGAVSCDSMFSAPIQGYMLGVLSACLSALAGVYTEFLMKKNNDSLYWQNVQLYTFGAIFNMARLLVDDFRGGFENGPWWQRLFNGYTITTWLVVLNLGSSGLLVSWLMKYADNIVKVYSTSMAMLLTMVLSVYLFNFKPTLQLFLGIVICMMSLHMYFAPSNMIVDIPVTVKAAPESLKDVSVERRTDS